LPRRFAASARAGQAVKISGLGVAAALVVLGCSTTPKPGPAPSTSADTVRSPRPSDVLVRVTSSESFSPQRGEAAIRAFVPEIAPVDSGGECFTGRLPGSGATTISASFPTRKAARTTITLTFDSAGHLARYSETRGVPHPQSPAGLTDAQRQEAVRMAIDTTRSTSLSFDYAIDQAIVMNRGGRKPTNAIMGTVRSFERLDKLGPPIARIERARKLCGV